MLDLTTHQSALLILLARTRFDRANNNHLHTVADDHVPSLTVAVMYALLKGKKAFKASRDPAAVRQAVHDALLQSMPKVLLKTMVAGGEAGIKKLGTMRVAGDVDGHPFHGNQWTSGSGSIIAQAKKSLTETKKASETGFVLPDGTRLKKAAEHETSIKGVAIEQVLESGIIRTTPGGDGYLGGVEVRAPISARQAEIVVDDNFRSGFAADVWLPDKSNRISRVFQPETKADVFHSWVKSVQAGKESANEFGIWQPRKLGGFIRTAKGPLTSPFKMSFDASNTRAAAWARDHAAELATGVSDTTEQIIRDAIARTQDEGDLSEQYDEILAAIGDEDRASLIARTESMTAANEGNRQGWDQAVDAGLLTGDEQRVWIATSDACPECDALDEEETGLDGSYPGDGEDGPPLHPNCRCTEGLVL